MPVDWLSPIGARRGDRAEPRALSELLSQARRRARSSDAINPLRKHDAPALYLAPLLTVTAENEL